jgi:hypothetical protein
MFPLTYTVKTVTYTVAQACRPRRSAPEGAGQLDAGGHHQQVGTNECRGTAGYFRRSLALLTADGRRGGRLST